MPKRTTTLLFIIGLISIVSAYVAISTRTTSAQAQPADKPIEQTRKNIQVLKGLREFELYRVMNFMAVSIGEQCTFCHVINGKDPKTGQNNWVWESDEKPEKQTGRRMLQMVLMINGSNKIDFTQNSVTCFTCHRGQTTTVGLPLMPLAKSGHEGMNDPAPPAPASRTRPSVEEVFARYVQAIGGTNASGTKTLFMKGTRVASQNRNALNEITLSLPDKLLIVATTPQGSVRQILAGDNGWILNGANLRTLNATEAGDARRSLEAVFGIVKVSHAPGMQLAGLEKINGRDMWVVAESTPEKRVTYDFDAETGLLRRKTTINHTFALPIPEQIDFEDYRDVDGVKIPFAIRSSAIDTYDNWTRTFTEIKRNVAVDEKLFAKPEPSK
ncbi:MAG TPA: photosynthetic reaction center cytochrome c subunit family protein [Pyrinomonadaceae bacterium]|nr:photosynthetic reaction center cytochrome c subunit family protein [Pyrinomonadaceae bacterium]